MARSVHFLWVAEFAETIYKIFASRLRERDVSSLIPSYPFVNSYVTSLSAKLGGIPERVAAVRICIKYRSKQFLLWKP